ncbi:hypothetical protein GSUB_17620 (plasmid) [Geoalkalibacter subterraneus]|uniref:PilZ domain-containing protein n=2 Tax=Geoalkalibacter subterraneus TaxID=483547 RepID=A0A0B5FVY0_9BACT|nr:hypothetical protein GSUB_17620 [Geoalkalibacter subterraneus]
MAVVSFRRDVFASYSDGDFRSDTYDICGPAVVMQAAFREKVSDNQILVDIIKAFEYDQKREYFRVNTSFPIQFNISGSDLDFSQEFLKPLGQCLNLSGGGLLFSADARIESSKRVWLDLCLPGKQSEPIGCVARVVRTVKDKEQCWNIAVSFDQIKEADRDEIIQYCFSEHRRHLRLKNEVVF